MAYSYALTQLAKTDIDEVLDYISVELANSKAVSNLYHAVQNAIESACDLPYACPDCLRYFVQDTSYHRRIVHNYLLIYRVNEVQHRIEALRLLYARRDIGASSIEMGVTDVN